MRIPPIRNFQFYVKFIKRRLLKINKRSFVGLLVQVNKYTKLIRCCYGYFSLFTATKQANLNNIISEVNLLYILEIN